MKTNGLVLIVGLLFLLNGQLIAQESKGLGVGIGADMASRYLWRGLNIGGECAHIQPYVSANYKFLEVGAWSSYGLSNNNAEGTNYFEYDFYAKLTVKNFGLGFTNYNIQDYGNSSEMTLSYEGGEKLPLHASFNKYVINDDASYIDMGYVFFKEKLIPVDLVVGATPAAGSYGEKGGIVNISLRASYETMKSEKFSLPIFSTFVYNPQIEKSFFVVGIALSTK